MTKERPIGVTILAVLEAILGVMVLLGGLSIVIEGFILSDMIPRVRWFPTRIIGGGIALLVFALIDFALAIGLWVGKRWAWIAGLVCAILGIMLGVFSLFVRPGIGELVALVLDLVIIYYLMQPKVQAYFPKGLKAAAASTG
ncbi:MAG: DUF2127 domain-containing protein [Candidatus Bathyarchaeia archaeon]